MPADQYRYIVIARNRSKYEDRVRKEHITCDIEETHQGRDAAMKEWATSPRHSVAGSAAVRAAGRVAGWVTTMVMAADRALAVAT